MSTFAVNTYDSNVDNICSPRSSLDLDLSFAWAHSEGARQFCEIISAAASIAAQDIFLEDDLEKEFEVSPLLCVKNGHGDDYATEEKYIFAEDSSRHLKRKVQVCETTGGSAVQTHKIAKKMRRVSFAPSVKQHDGLSEESRVFDSLMVQLFCKRDPMLVHSMCLDLSSKLQLVRSIKRLTDNLIQDILRSKDPVPILSKGGGSCIKLSTSHVEGLEWMLRVLNFTSGQDSA